MRPAQRFPSVGIARVRYWESPFSISTFRRYASRDAPGGQLHAGYPAALILTTLILVALAVVAFRRRDLGT